MIAGSVASGGGNAGGTPWSAAQRIAFRFVFSYLAIYLAPEVIGLTPLTGRFATPLYALWQPLVVWVAHRVFHLDNLSLSSLPDGGGDSTVGALLLLLRVAMAILATSLWTLFDRRSTDHRRLDAGLRVVVRYTLAYTLLQYGAIKILKMQFSFPGGTRLAELYGDASPMGLLWTFMGYSTSYTVFTGLVETGAGLLLLFRRTATAGALLAVAAMANVTAINFSYDVFVKHWAAHLLLFSVFLLAPELRRLTDLLVLDRPTAAVPPPPRWEPRWLDRCRRACAALVAAVLIFLPFRDAWNFWWPVHRPGHRTAPPHPAYAVAQVLRGGKLLPGWPMDANSWLWFIYQPAGAVIVTADIAVLSGDYDAARQTLVLYHADQQGHRQGHFADLACTRWGQDPMILSGTLGREPIVVVLRRFTRPSALELARFHWINDGADAEGPPAPAAGRSAW